MQGLIKTLVLLAAFTYNVAQAETCKKQLSDKECQKALGQIGYDTRGNVRKTSNIQVLSSGHCQVTIQTKKGGPISTSGSGLSEALYKVLDRKYGDCKNQPGVEDIQNPTNITGFQTATLLVEYIEDKPAPVACKVQLDPKECQKALGQIGYDTKGNAFKTANKQVLSSGHCQVTIQTKKGGPIASSGSGLSAALNKVLDRQSGGCKNQPGVEDIENPTNITGFQSATLLIERIEDKPVPVPVACKVQLDPKDCQKALGQIGYDTKGNAFKTVNKQVLSSGRCQVTIQTKKGGPIASSGSGLSAALNKVLDRQSGGCKNQPGVEDIENPTNITGFQSATLLVECIEDKPVPVPVTCKDELDPKDCQKALGQIGYDTKGNVLKTVNKQVLSCGHCKVTIQTKKGGPIANSGSGLSEALNKVLDRKNGECKNQPGVEDIQNPTNISNFQTATLLVERIEGKAAPCA